MKVIDAKDLRDLLRLVLDPFASRIISPNAEQRLARLMGRIAFAVLREQRGKIAHGLSVAFGRDLTPDQVRRLTRKVFENLSVDSLCFSPGQRNLTAQRVAIEGLEHLREALGRGRGVILWDSPFGKRLLAKAALAEKGFALWQVHNQAHGGSSSWLGQRFFREMYRKAERKLFHEIVDVPDDSFAYLRLLVNRLKQNGIVCMMALGPEGYKFVSTDFLGSKQNFATGSVNLARISGASIVPIFCVTEADRRHRVILSNPIRFEENGNWDEAVLQGVSGYAALLESYIRRYPDHWHFWHKLAPR